MNGADIVFLVILLLQGCWTFKSSEFIDNISTGGESKNQKDLDLYICFSSLLCTDWTCQTFPTSFKIQATCSLQNK